MMAYKHLHELLKEDQEPFQLQSYIADRRGQLNKRAYVRPTSTSLQVKKRKPIVETSSSLLSKRSSFCQHACFLSFHDSPDVRRSPFLEFPSPAAKRSPCKAQNGAVLLHVPARTASLLLEAAMRVQKQQSSKTKTQIKHVGFGLFGSILKRLKDRSKSKKAETRNIKSAYEVEEKEKVREESKRSAYDMSVSCSCNNSRLSSAGWSESNEEKSLMDLESSSSCCRSDEDFLEDDAFPASCEERFCSSPFRFALQRSPSTSRRTPDFSPPPASPIRHKKEEKENCEAEGLNHIQLEDEEKEQNSPVSVLDNPFEDDDDGHECQDAVEDVDEDEDENGYGVECSYAIVQRAKQELLDRLRRFEKLAELDPIELEKRMVEQMDEDQPGEDEDEDDDNESASSYGDDGLSAFLTEVLSKSSLQQSRKISADMRRLVFDLISEEKHEINGFNDQEVVMKRVSKKLDSWKEVQSNTIDMMVQLDFGREFGGWKKYQEQMGEIATEIEFEMLKILVDELSEDLVY